MKRLTGIQPPDSESGLDISLSGEEQEELAAWDKMLSPILVRSGLNKVLTYLPHLPLNWTTLAIAKILHDWEGTSTWLPGAI